MNRNLKVLTSSLGVAAVVLTVLSTVASAQARQEPRGSVYGPYYNPHYQSNGTGTVPDWNRDPHNDR
jgi:hypothetical protein